LGILTLIINKAPPDPENQAHIYAEFGDLVNRGLSDEWEHRCFIVLLLS